jgi:hypothetical protein
MNWMLTGEISGGIIVGMWAVAYAIAGVRRLMHGSFVPEAINDAFYLKYSAQAAAEGWLHRFLVVFDIALNVLLRGQEDETLSSRAYRASLERKVWGIVLNYWLDLIQSQHGPKAMVGDMWRAINRLTVGMKVLGISGVVLMPTRPAMPSITASKVITK